MPIDSPQPPQPYGGAPLRPTGGTRTNPPTGGPVICTLNGCGRPMTPIAADYYACPHCDGDAATNTQPA